MNSESRTVPGHDQRADPMIWSLTALSQVSPRF
jgi:hypothetical protein